MGRWTREALDTVYAARARAHEGIEWARQTIRETTIMNESGDGRIRVSVTGDCELDKVSLSHNTRDHWTEEALGAEISRLYRKGVLEANQLQTQVMERSFGP